MKIPTILALALLITALSLGIMLFVYYHKLEEKNKIALSPKNIKVVNITNTQATLVWQTDQPAQGTIFYGTSNLNQKQLDDRDVNQPKERISHFVTLRNLNAQTNYSYKIRSQKFTFPQDKSLFFNTAPDTKSVQDQDFTNISPLRGVLLNTDLTPSDDSLIFLNIPGISELATFSTISGNFIMPLVNLRTSDLKSLFKITGKIDAVLTIQKGLLESKIQLKLPAENQILPPLTLGQNINLDDYLASSQSKKQNSKSQENPFDLNNDGSINSLDLSTFTLNLNRKIKDRRFDFNHDNLIDQKDGDLLRKAFQ